MSTLNTNNNNNSNNVNKQQHISSKHRAVRRQLFPQKLWDLVNRPLSGIQWSPDGKRIHVERGQLEKFIGTKFRSHNFDSFIRQLHFYGFRKSGNSYHHDKFQRGQPAGLLSMKRKYSNLSSLCNIDSQSNSSTASESTVEKGNNDSLNISNNNDIVIDEVEHAIDYSSKSSISRASLAAAQCQTIVLKTTSNSGPLCHQTQITSKSLTNSTNTINTIACSNTNKINATKQVSKLNSNISNNNNKTVNSNDIKTNNNDNSKEITMYTLRSDKSETVEPFPSFTDIREDLAKVDNENASIKITIPELMNDNSEGAWPKTLVLNNYWVGGQNILSAYFLYKTKE